MKNKESVLTFSVAGKDIVVNRPEPITAEIEVFPFDKNTEVSEAISALVSGYYVLIEDFYSSALLLSRELKKYLKRQNLDDSFKGQREFRSLYRELSHRIVMEVNNQNLCVRKSPEIGWLKMFFSDIESFVLPFSQIQGLNSSWQWYKKGISIPQFEGEIHPFFGTYFPTRFEHLELFEHWLKYYRGEKKSAMDIGIGCGILTFQMLKHGFEKIYGTDSNPNAIVSIDKDLKIGKDAEKVELSLGNLFADFNQKTDLIVFNPPWLPASSSSEGIDSAIYYEKNMFEEFFHEASKRLESNGKVVLLFSNLAKITGVEDVHPIENELQNGNRFEKELFVHKRVRAASKKTRRDQNWRSSEVVELWVLKLKDN